MTRYEAEKVLPEDSSTLTQPADWTGSGTITCFSYTINHLTTNDSLPRGSTEVDVLPRAVKNNFLKNF